MLICLILLLLVGAAGCQANTSDPGNTSPDTDSENVTPDNDTEDNSSTLIETQTVVVEFVGQIDNNSIEVKIEDGPQALRLTGMSKEQLEALNPNEGDLIKLEVFNNEEGQQAIYSLEKADE